MITQTTDSILDSIKKMLGTSIPADYENAFDTAFDVDLIIQINTAFSILHRLGVGPEAGFSISDNTSVWNDFIDLSDKKHFNDIKTYVFLKVQLYFDPPANSSLLELKKEQIAELEWTLNVVSEKGDR